MFPWRVLSHIKSQEIIQPTDSTADLLSGHICSPLCTWTQRLCAFIENQGAFQRSSEIRGLHIASCTEPYVVHVLKYMCVAGRAGLLVIGRSLVQISALGRAELSCMSKWPWARYWTPNCSWCAVGTLRALRWAGNLSRVYPALTQRQLGLAPATTPATP